MTLNLSPVGDDLIKEVGEANFIAEVVEASQNTPIIVDFWAPWCGPCKTLGPALETAVKAAGGRVKMAKVNVDQNQRLAAQMQVQSIPAVFAFFQGKPIDGFMGAKPASELQGFVDKLAALDGAQQGDDLSEALAMAETMLSEGAAADAAQTFGAILAQAPDNAAAFVGLVRANMAAGEMTQATAMLQNTPEALQNTPEVLALKAQLDLAKQAENLGELGELKAKSDANPDDAQSRFDLAIALNAQGQTEQAVDQLIELYRRSPDWNDDAARQQLFKIFDVLGQENPLSLQGRRKLASLLFA